jgi:titin
MLSWKPPKSNGGLPLSGYIIERRDNKRPTWVKVDKVSPDTTTYKANNMLEGNMYNYRIIAENEEGASRLQRTKISFQSDRYTSVTTCISMFT